jgi:hypothetical protein
VSAFEGRKEVADANYQIPDGWNISASPQQLADTFVDLDPRMRTLMLNADDIKMWRCT